MNYRELPKRFWLLAFALAVCYAETQTRRFFQTRSQKG